MNLQFLRDYIRTQLDMDEEELPNALLDSYLDEAYNRTVSMETRWPFFEAYFEVAQTPDFGAIVLPAECNVNQIASVVDADTGKRLVQIGNEAAEDGFNATNKAAGAAAYYSVWGNMIHLWPRVAVEIEVHLFVRGYRNPTNWIALGASGEVDADPRLHILLAHYAIALCYAQQEDEVLEDVYMKRWQMSFAAARAAICAPRHHRPLVFNSGLGVGSPPSPEPIWNLPT